MHRHFRRAPRRPWRRRGRGQLLSPGRDRCWGAACERGRGLSGRAGPVRGAGPVRRVNYFFIPLMLLGFI